MNHEAANHEAANQKAETSAAAEKQTHLSATASAFETQSNRETSLSDDRQTSRTAKATEPHLFILPRQNAQNAPPSGPI